MPTQTAPGAEPAQSELSPRLDLTLGNCNIPHLHDVDVRLLSMVTLLHTTIVYAYDIDQCNTDSWNGLASYCSNEYPTVTVMTQSV
jgi:hypothetical protein